MRRLSRRSAMTEARRFKTLMLSRAVGGGAGGVAMPQPTAQNQMIIANATPAWVLLAAPTAQYQVPIAGADPYTPGWAAMTVAAISDLAYAAPASPSVSLATSAEGSGTPFARADHAHQLDQAIAPTWTALHTFNANVTLGGSAPVITIPDNLIDPSGAVRIVDAGGLEYLRIISTNAQPVVVFNDGGADVDHRWEASGQENALFVQGSDGKIGVWTDTLNARIEIGGAAGPAILNLPTNLSTIDAGLSTRDIADESIVTFGTNVHTNYTGRVVAAKAGACIRCDTRDHDGGTTNRYTVFHVLVRAADGGYTVPFQIAAGAPTGSLVIARSGYTGFGIAPQGPVHIYSSDYPRPFDRNSDAALIIDTTDDDGAILFEDGTNVTRIRGDGGAFSISSRTSAGAIVAGDLKFAVDSNGAVNIRENSATVRLTGTKSFLWSIPDPAVGACTQIRIPWDCTVRRVDANIIGGTSCTFNIEERSTLGSSGTDILSSDMVADADGESVTSGFNNSSLAEGNYLTIDISAVSGLVGEVNIMLTVTLT